MFNQIKGLLQFLPPLKWWVSLQNYHDKFNIINMKKIVKIHSQFNIEVLSVDNCGMNIYRNTPLDDVLLDNPFNKRIRVVNGKIAEDYWRTMINETLIGFNLNLEQPNRTVDLNYIHQLFTHEDFNEIDDYINMKVAKYI